MDNPEIERVFREQEGVIAVWQMRHAGLSEKAIRWRCRGLRRLHSGVYLSGHATPTDRQRWWAATLTAPGSVLSHISAAASHGFAQEPSPLVTITRPGRGPRARRGNLLVSYATEVEAVTDRGLWVASPGQTLADLAGYVDQARLRRMVRDALRLSVLDVHSLGEAVRSARGRPGVASLRWCLAEYGALPVARGRRAGARSDAEVLALAYIKRAGLQLPSLNARRAGYEADLSWPTRKLIIELDGRSFHQFPDEDRIRDRTWHAAGWTVVRIPTDVVYQQPDAFLAEVRRFVAR